MYTVDFHRDTALRLIELTLPHAMPERFSRLIVMNTANGMLDQVLGGDVMADLCWHSELIYDACARRCAHA